MALGFGLELLCYCGVCGFSMLAFEVSLGLGLEVFRVSWYIMLSSVVVMVKVHLGNVMSERLLHCCCCCSYGQGLLSSTHIKVLVLQGHTHQWKSTSQSIFRTIIIIHAFCLTFQSTPCVVIPSLTQCNTATIARTITLHHQRNKD